MALTPEEEKELQELEAEFSPKEQEELSALETELEEAPSEQAPVETATIEPEIGAALSTANPMLEQSVEEIVPTEEVRKAQGYGAIEGIPFAKDAISSALTMAQGGTENFSERKRANQKQWDQEYNRYMQRYPYATMEGDFTSSALAFGALGVAFPFTTGAAASVGLGAASGYSRTQDREDMTEVGFNVGLGAVSGAAPFALGLGAKAAGKGLGVLKRGGEYLGRGMGLLGRETFQEMTGVINANSVNKMAQHFSKTAKNKSLQEAEQEGIQRLLSYTTEDGSPVIVAGNNYSKVNMNAKAARDVRGKQLGRIVEELDSGNFEKLNSEDLKNKVLEKVLIKKPNLTPEEMATNKELINIVENNIIAPKKVPIESVTKHVPEESVGPDGHPIKKMIEVVEKQYKEVPHQYTAKDLHQLKLDSASQLNFKPSGQQVLSSEKAKVYEVMREVSDNILQKASPKYKQTNLEWSDLLMIENSSAEAHVYRKSSAHKYVKQVYKTGATLTRGETVKSNITKANAVIVGLEAMENAEGFNPQMKPRTQKIKDFISVSPDSVYTKRMITAAMVANSSGNTSYDAVNDTIEAISAEISLMESPVKRNINDIKMKSDLLLDIIDFYSPMQADSLRDALENRDDEAVRMMMDQASKMPEVGQIFEDGKGIDGRVFSEEDKQALRDEVEAMDISLKQKLQHLDQLDKQGLVPQVQEEPERFFQPKWRNKNKPRY